MNKSLIFALTAVILWSTAATAFKISLIDFDFSNLLFYSSLTSTAIFFIVILFKYRNRVSQIFSKTSLLNSALLGFLNPFLYYMVLLKAYSILPAQIAQPLNYLWPVMLTLLAIPMLKQKISVKQIIAIVISFLGVVVISQQGEWFSIKKDDIFGILLASGSSIIWALYWIFNVKDKRNDTIKLFLNFLFGTIYTGIYISIFNNFNFSFSISGISTIYVGFFEMGITFYLWLIALKASNNTAKISNVVFLSPFLSLIFISLILKEEIFITTIPGIILILAGVIFQQILSKKND